MDDFFSFFFSDWLRACMSEILDENFNHTPLSRQIEFVKKKKKKKFIHHFIAASFQCVSSEVAITFAATVPKSVHCPPLSLVA